MTTVRHGPWIDLPDRSYLALEDANGSIDYTKITKRYRISTIESKREFVVGKWYRISSVGFWVKCIALHEDGRAYCISSPDGCAYPYNKDSIDWFTGPKDEHP
jgi:hypothetical protein